MSIFFFLLGLIIGSFLNVVILRLKDGKSLFGRSVCPACGKIISWYDNIPLLSFILLGGKCRACKTKISWQYPIVELASGFLWLLGYCYVMAGPGAVVIFNSTKGIASSRLISGLAMTADQWLGVITLGIFFSILLALFVFDCRWYILPDQITLLGIVIALLANILWGHSWQNILLAMLIGATWFGWQYLISHGRWVGSGDIRLGALMGAMLAGWQGLLVALFLAYLAGAVVAVVLLLLGKKTWGERLPFGTFLTVTTIISLIYGEVIWGWYFTLLEW